MSFNETIIECYNEQIFQIMRARIIFLWYFASVINDFLVNRQMHLKQRGVKTRNEKLGPSRWYRLPVHPFLKRTGQ